MNTHQFQEYAQRVANNTSGMLDGITKKTDGTPRDMPSDLAAGVLAAQSNLAIASALMWIAAELKDHR